MARTVRNAKIDTPSARAKLAKRREPYWVVLTKGCAVGYRKGKNGGNWIARWRGPEGKQNYRALGATDDALNRKESGGKTIAYAEAQEKAREWFAKCGSEDGSGQVSGPYTVKQAIEDYLAAYKQRGGKAVQDARTRADALILPDLGAIEVKLLTAKHIRDWHAGLAEAAPRLRTRKGQKQQYRETNGDPEAPRRRKATANRTLAILKAALNYAWGEGEVVSDDAWRRAKPFREVDAARARHLEKGQLTHLVNACDPDFRRLVQAALFTGCRYGELAALRTGDFDPNSGTLHVRRSKTGKARSVYLTDEGQGFFDTLTAGRPDGDLMLAREGGGSWGRAQQQRPMKNTCKRAKINPPVGFHALRHTYASLLVMADVPLLVIAENLGHADTRMVEKHYGHLTKGFISDTIRTKAPKLGIAKRGKITRLRTARA